MRKTNFYWFAMMQKLQDPGTIHTYEGTRVLNEIEYDLVKLTFEKGVGDVSDIYLLYINPQTNLVDQFLFTVLDFGIEEPFLMEVKYEKFNNVMLPTYRRFIQSNWDGKIMNNNWIEEIMTDLKFGNGYTKVDFKKPKKK